LGTATYFEELPQGVIIFYVG